MRKMTRRPEGVMGRQMIRCVMAYPATTATMIAAPPIDGVPRLPSWAG